jgi:hypothetical protein
MFGVVTGQRRKLHNEELHNMQFSQVVLGEIVIGLTSCRMQWEETIIQKVTESRGRVVSIPAS